ncbi:hypothetical protein [Paraferrimonas sp. SM1919]|uniref:hypothetical protein n=1 Tax=Paraferrimonas sp. SM1919 TaxID=2662263 RepID=UPI0013D89F5C|nr:hypothetical protein [Paraferrimonas sp. SM1919]
MKNVINILLLSLAVSISFHANSQQQCAVESDEEGVITKAATDADREKAVQVALKEIANQVQVDVSTMDSVREQLTGDEYQSDTVASVSVSSDLTFTGMDVCHTFDELTNTYSVTVTVDTRNLTEKFAAKLTRKWNGLPSKLNFMGNATLVDSMAIKQLNGRLVNPAAANTKDVHIGLSKQHGKWYLTIDGISELIDQNQLFSYIHFDHAGEALGFLKRTPDWQTESVNRLTEDDRFKMSIQPHGKKYFQLINVYKNGNVAPLLGIQKAPSEQFDFPSGERRWFKAALNNHNQQTTDYYVLLRANEHFQVPAQLPALQVGDEPLKGDQSDKLELFLDWLEVNKANVESTFVHIDIKPHG